MLKQFLHRHQKGFYCVHNILDENLVKMRHKKNLRSASSYESAISNEYLSASTISIDYPSFQYDEVMMDDVKPMFPDRQRDIREISSSERKSKKKNDKEPSSCSSFGSHSRSTSRSNSSSLSYSRSHSTSDSSNFNRSHWTLAHDSPLEEIPKNSINLHDPSPSHHHQRQRQRQHYDLNIQEEKVGSGKGSKIGSLENLRTGPTMIDSASTLLDQPFGQYNHAISPLSHSTLHQNVDRYAANVELQTPRGVDESSNRNDGPMFPSFSFTQREQRNEFEQHRQGNWQPHGPPPPPAPPPPPPPFPPPSRFGSFKSKSVRSAKKQNHHEQVDHPSKHSEPLSMSIPQISPIVICNDNDETSELSSLSSPSQFMKKKKLDRGTAGVRNEHFRCSPHPIHHKTLKNDMHQNFHKVGPQTFQHTHLIHKNSPCEHSSHHRHCRNTEPLDAIQESYVRRPTQDDTSNEKSQTDVGTKMERKVDIIASNQRSKALQQVMKEMDTGEGTESEYSERF